MAAAVCRIVHLEAGRRLYGGALQVRYLMGGLAAHGVDNVLLCPHGAAVGQGYPDYQAGPRPGGRTCGPSRGLSRGPGQAGIRRFGIAMGGDGDLSLCPRLMLLLRRLRPDLVHVHSRRGADVWGGLAAAGMGLPAVISRRVDNPDPAWLARLKAACFQRVISISRGIEQVQLSQGVPASRLRYVASAVDAGVFRPGGDQGWLRHAFALPPSGPVLGVVAQFIRRKGHRHLLAVLPALRRLHPGLTVLFLGRGPEEGALRRMISDHGLGPAVRMTGFRDDLPRILPALDLLVHPADAEGLGVALLQAGACGVPVVASRVGGIPECIRHGHNGLLVPPADTGALLQAVDGMLSRPGLAARLGGNGRRLVREHFSVDAMVRGNLAVYREIVAGGLIPSTSR